eukprot:4888_1
MSAFLLLIIVRISFSNSTEDGRFIDTEFGDGMGFIYRPVATIKPTKSPTNAPTLQPTPPTIAPTLHPTHSPTNYPSKQPTHQPTTPPTHVPTSRPTYLPTKLPTTKKPIHLPHLQPIHLPPTQPPTNPPTTSPTHSPTKLPTTIDTKPQKRAKKMQAKANTARRDKEGEQLLQDMIAKANQAKQAPIIKLYALQPDVFCSELLDALECELSMMDDADTVIVRNKEASANEYPYFADISSYFTATDPLLHYVIQPVALMMVDFNALLDAKTLNGALTEIVNLTVHLNTSTVFDNVCLILSRKYGNQSSYSSQSSARRNVLSAIQNMYYNHMDRSRFLVNNTVLDVAVDYILFTFLEIVTLSIEQLAATLVQSEYSKSDQFPHDKAKKWIDYLAQTVRTMHVIIPRLTYLIQEDISSNHCKLSKQSLYLFENIVTLVRTMIVFKSNINIASKVFMYRTSSTKKIIHVAMLVHGVNGKAIVLQSLLNKLGYDNKNIHRFEATLNQNYKRARKKSLFNFVPLRTIPHESELSDVDYVSTSSALSVQTCTNMTITVFVVKPASPQYLHDLERELVLRQVGDMILIKFEQTLSTAEVKKTVKMEPKMSIISYHEHIDMILEETLWFLKSINDLENNVSLQLQFGSMMVHDLRKIHQTQWDAAYSFLYRKYHNKSSDHQKILQ